MIMSRVMGFPSVAIQIELFSISIISTQIQFLVAPKLYIMKPVQDSLCYLIESITEDLLVLPR